VTKKPRSRTFEIQMAPLASAQDVKEQAPLTASENTRDRRLAQEISTQKPERGAGQNS
jgi:hypothetical protein